MSEHKEGLFAFAGTALLVGGWLQWRNRFAPCPSDPLLRDACLRTRTTSLRLYLFSAALCVVGAWFAFVQPWLAGIE